MIKDSLIELHRKNLKKCSFIFVETNIVFVLLLELFYETKYRTIYLIVLT
jgi:hypothetical protein